MSNMDPTPLIDSERGDDQIYNTYQRKPKGLPRMDNPVTRAAQETIFRREIINKTKQKHTNNEYKNAT